MSLHFVCLFVLILRRGTIYNTWWPGTHSVAHIGLILRILLFLPLECRITWVCTISKVKYFYNYYPSLKLLISTLNLSSYFEKHCFFNINIKKTTEKIWAFSLSNAVDCCCKRIKRSVIFLRNVSSLKLSSNKYNLTASYHFLGSVNSFPWKWVFFYLYFITNNRHIINTYISYALKLQHILFPIESEFSPSGCHLEN